MKALTELNNVDKARLLFQLFPEEIPALTAFIGNMCYDIQQDAEVNRSTWNDPFIEYNYWLTLAGTIAGKIDHYGTRLHKKPSLFADQLFDIMEALVTIRCIRTYVTVRQHPNSKLTTAIDLLFNLK
jgi:hypothetical protein